MMHKFGISGAALACLGVATIPFAVLAQSSSEWTNVSECNSNNAAPGNNAPTASLSIAPANGNSDASYKVTATTTDPDGDDLSYDYTISGGTITGEGSEVIWDLSGMYSGTYEITAFISDGRGCYAMVTHHVEVTG